MPASEWSSAGLVPTGLPRRPALVAPERLRDPMGVHERVQDGALDA